MDREGDQAGGHEDQDDAGDREEPAQVDADPGREDRPADGDGHGQPGDGRDEGLDGRTAGGADGEQEEDRLQPFAGDGHEREPGEREA